MKVTTTIKETREQIKAWKKEGCTIGLVPTMGYLHEGHASLIRKCREENDKVVVSVFVNPTQFGPNEDLESYPRDFQRDCTLCEEIGADLIFHPQPEEMYHNPCAFVNINTLSDNLCGKTRPIHFKGVCTVVSKLFNIVTPDNAYFGQKDAQLQELITPGCDAKMIQDEMTKVILAEPLARIDYVSVVDALTMQPVETVTKDVLVAMAVYIGKTRLIDNFSYEV